MPLTSTLKKVGLDWFILALGTVIFLAWLWPTPGVVKEPISLGQIAGYGVSVIFFFYGLRLSPGQLKSGLSNYKLHTVIQVSTFIFFPVLLLAVHPLLKDTSYEMLWLGAFYLAALPSTVSSSVVMVSIAGGNIPAAIFNASISGLLGVFPPPLWMGLFLTAQDGNYDLSGIFLKLFLQVLLPVGLGLLLHKRLGAFAEKTKGRLKYFDQVIILLIIYTSFCESFSQNLFVGLGWDKLLALIGAMLMLFMLAYAIIFAAGKVLGFNKPDMITAIFCGSKKSLVHGTVMSKVLFSASMAVGVILLPLMIYHAMQLIIASIIAQRLSSEPRLPTAGRD
jgi:sodium/bile acid cotransporter 7